MVQFLGCARREPAVCYHALSAPPAGERITCADHGTVRRTALSFKRNRMQTPLTFGRWLKRLRSALDLTQEMLAEEVGCAADTIRAFESGRRRPSRSMIERLVDVLQVPEAERAEFVRVARASSGEQPSAVLPADESPEVLPLLRRPRLPVAPTALIGRAWEARELVRRLNNPTCRLVTILGPGGAGKTRLALEVAANFTAHSTTPVGFVSLAQVLEPDHVAVAIADVLGCPLMATATVAESLLAFLQERELLLVLDNLEHVLDATPLLAAVLREAPQVLLLVTSRERLRLPGEHVFELSGLGTPVDDSRTAVDRADAVLLFLERARQVATDFALTPLNRGAVATICRLVDGMPLGIELAAAWVRALSPTEIAAEIARSIDFLTLSDRSADPRHRSMRAVIDHSWALLTTDEQRVLSRLCIFRGGCTREAAQAVAGATLPILAGLLDKSLIRRTSTGRYEMHELVRQYAADQLAADPAAFAIVRDRHCTYYTDWLATRASAMTGAQQHTGLADIATELDNLRTAWHYGVDQRQVRPLERIADDGLLWFYEVRSWYQEAESMCRRATAAFRTPPPTSRAEELVLGTLTGMQGWFTFRRGQAAAGMALLDESVRILRPGDHPQWLFNSLVQLAYLALFQGDFDRAAALVEEHSVLAEGIHNPWVRAHVLVQQAAVHVDRKPEVAYERLQDSLPYIRSAGDPYLITLCLNYLADTALILGHVDEAERLFIEARTCSVASENGIMEVLALSGLAGVASRRQAWSNAITYALDAVARSNEVGEVWSRAKAHVVLGEAERGGGDPAAARQTLIEALRMSLTTRLVPTALEAWVGIASLDLQSETCRAALLALLPLVRAHPALPHRTTSRVGELWTELAAEVDEAKLSAAEANALRTGHHDLLALLTMYCDGPARVGLDLIG